MSQIVFYACIVQYFRKKRSFSKITKFLSNVIKITKMYLHWSCNINCTAIFNHKSLTTLPLGNLIIWGETYSSDRFLQQLIMYTHNLLTVNSI